ncbi:hypothetical protein NC651_025725 [Populus alba x Populus x berolinensis]|nr:hypothetical protein NC651_025725 [Populus alba x Populus x berolinensis]
MTEPWRRMASKTVAFKAIVCSPCFSCIRS